MLYCSFCSLSSRCWFCSLLVPCYFSLRLLGCGLQRSSCTPSRNHPLKGCRLLPVCHVLMLPFCCLRASLCLLLISARSAVLCNGLFYRIFQSRCFLLVRPFGLRQCPVSAGCCLRFGIAAPSLSVARFFAIGCCTPPCAVSCGAAWSLRSDTFPFAIFPPALDAHLGSGTRSPFRCGFFPF